MAGEEYIGVTAEAIAAEKSLESRLRELQIDLLKGVKNLITEYDQNKTGLGAHAASIDTLIKDLVDLSAGEASGPVLKLVKKLKRSANARQAAIDNDIYGSGRSR